MLHNKELQKSLKTIPELKVRKKIIRRIILNATKDIKKIFNKLKHLTC